MCDSVNTISIEGAHYGLVNPIPITEEWLLKFGFENKTGRDEEEFYIKDNFQLELMFLSEEDTGFYFFSPVAKKDIKIKHIHQLQNIYHALTGEDFKLNQ